MKSKKPVEERLYFFDNCISPHLARAMKCIGANVTHLQEEGFQPHTLDVEWIPVVAAKGWVVVTSDLRILSREHERAALRAAGSVAFFLPNSTPRKPRWDQAAFLTKCWPGIVASGEYARPGDCFEVQENGKVKRMEPL